MDAFEDIKREYVNNFHEARGKLLASSYEEFVRKVLHAIQTTLNETDVGRRFTDDALGTAIRTNATPDDWRKTKVNIMAVMFWLIMDECPQLRHEMAMHLYDELKEGR